MINIDHTHPQRVKTIDHHEVVHRINILSHLKPEQIEKKDAVHLEPIKQKAMPISEIPKGTFSNTQATPVVMPISQVPNLTNTQATPVVMPISQVPKGTFTNTQAVSVVITPVHTKAEPLKQVTVVSSGHILTPNKTNTQHQSDIHQPTVKPSNTSKPLISAPEVGESPSVVILALRQRIEKLEAAEKLMIENKTDLDQRIKKVLDHTSSVEKLPNDHGTQSVLRNLKKQHFNLLMRRNNIDVLTLECHQLVDLLKKELSGVEVELKHKHLTILPMTADKPQGDTLSMRGHLDNPRQPKTLDSTEVNNKLMNEINSEVPAQVAEAILKEVGQKGTPKEAKEVVEKLRPAFLKNVFPHVANDALEIVHKEMKKHSHDINHPATPALIKNAVKESIHKHWASDIKPSVDKTVAEVHSSHHSTQSPAQKSQKICTTTIQSPQANSPSVPNHATTASHDRHISSQTIIQATATHTSPASTPSSNHNSNHEIAVKSLKSPPHMSSILIA